jgi:hypothetical protein
VIGSAAAFPIPPPFWADETSRAISPTTARTNSTKSAIFHQLHGRSPLTRPVRPLIRIWNSRSWYR